MSEKFYLKKWYRRLITLAIPIWILSVIPIIYLIAEFFKYSINVYSNFSLNSLSIYIIIALIWICVYGLIRFVFIMFNYGLLISSLPLDQPIFELNGEYIKYWNKNQYKLIRKSQIIKTFFFEYGSGVGSIRSLIVKYIENEKEAKVEIFITGLNKDKYYISNLIKQQQNDYNAKMQASKEDLLIEVK